jgi:hypothetical protein
MYCHLIPFLALGCQEVSCPPLLSLFLGVLRDSIKRKQNITKHQSMPSMNTALLNGSLEKQFFKLLAIKKGVQEHISGIVLSDQVLK